jgi:Cys-rich four helix bundle protein (predicted Tat secretion target)
MNRKEFLKNTALSVATVSTVSGLMAQSHDHEMKPGSASSKSKYSKAMMSAVHCQLAAENCLAHCINEMGKGDKSLVKCANSTREVIAACEAFVKMASFESSFTGKMADLCEDVCKACAAECKKHAEHHPECKECMDSCLSCAKEMSKV